jgi:ATP-dependent RNA helicase RhlE
LLDWLRTTRRLTGTPKLIMSFASLGLSEPLVRACADSGYTQPTPIQTEAIPAVLAGGDLLAGAQTGTGKTAGFVLPILERLSKAAPFVPPQGAKGRAAVRPVRVLILTPTRELAAQVEESVRVYGKFMKQIKSTMIFGGVGFTPQVVALNRGVDIVVATPGRLLDHVQQRTIDLSKIETLVLDEADRMLDMGFIHDIKRLLTLLPESVNGLRRQNLLFSATFSDEIRALADKLLSAPKMIQIAARNSTVEVITQKIYPVSRDKKRQLLTHLVRENNWSQVLVFARTKHGANRLADQLTEDGIKAAAFHGNKSQGARTAALSKFKANQLQVLVATDIAARGIDIDQLPHVVNYELPNVSEDYVHRIGRTGRAGATGEAVSLVCVDENGLLRDIERLIKKNLPREIVPGFEPDPSERAKPIQLRSGQAPGRGQQQRPQRAGAPSGKPAYGHAGKPAYGGNAGKPAGNHAPKPAYGSKPQAPHGARPAQAAPGGKPSHAAPARHHDGKPAQRNARPAFRSTALTSRNG